MGYYFSDYLHDDSAHNGRRDKAVKIGVRSIKRFCKNQHTDVDFSAVCGASGLRFGSILAYKLGLPCVIVRKDAEVQSSHARLYNENISPATQHEPGRKYIIVDDFIAYGNTAKFIRDRLQPCTCIGYYGYATKNCDNERNCRRLSLVCVPQCVEFEDYTPGMADLANLQSPRVEIAY
jgi:hypothetical protein